MKSSSKAAVVALLAILFALYPTGGASGAAEEPKPTGTGATIPAGTILYLRLQTAISTKTSKKGQTITAGLAREVAVPDGVAIPIGSTLKGKIEKCFQPTRPDQRAELLLSFAQLAIPDEGNLSLKGRLTEISNARETLLADGTIMGILQTEAPASLLGGVLQKLGTINSSIGDQIQKKKIGEVNTGIEYPVGTDLQVTLSEPLAVKKLFASSAPGQLPADLRASLASLLADAPQRSASRDKKAGDPVNLLFVGTAEEVRQAFRQGGWIEPQESNQQSVLKTAEAVAKGEGYGAAPVSDLYVYGRKEDIAFEKVLNTFNKRHHLRLWQMPEQGPDGRPVWLAAATHDIGLDIRPGVISHATDPNLDDERAQVGADLVAGGAVQALELISPPNPLNSGMTATGGAWHTDGKLLVIDLKPEASASQ